MTASTRAVGLVAFFTLMLIALMMGANHVAARGKKREREDDEV